MRLSKSDAVTAIGVVLLGIALPAVLYVAIAIPEGLAARPVVIAQAATPTTMAGGGVTLRSVHVDLPNSDRLFPYGQGADAINANCLACHSAGMVLNQPALSKEQWTAEVDKMRTTYKAPVDARDVDAIVEYLVGLRLARRASGR
jgi:hypothetical protein